MIRVASIIVVLDSLIGLASYCVGHFVRFGELQNFFVSSQAVFQFAIYISIVLLSGYFCELYTEDLVYQRSELAARISISIMASFFVLAAIYYISPDNSLGRGVLSLSLLVYGLLHYIRQRVWQGIFSSSPFTKKIMILGTGQLADTIQKKTPFSIHNYQFAGFIEADNEAKVVNSNHIVGNVSQIEEILLQGGIQQLVLALTEKRGTLPVKVLMSCKLKGIEIFDPLSFYEKVSGKLLVEEINPSWFVYSKGFRITPFRRACKRSLDILFSLLGIFLVLPLMPLFALLIKLTSPGPVLFSQMRVGEGGKEFMLYKFRTMCDDAERNTGAVWATEDDPRVTKVGRIYRKLRIDEIPQLFNVLKGDMSFIGPRPERKEFVDQLTKNIPYYGVRHSIKSGITGWAQVKYPYGASEEDALEKLRYDLYYIKNFTVFLDLMILLATIKVVIFGRGGR